MGWLGWGGDRVPVESAGSFAIQKTSRTICLPQNLDRLLPKVHLAEASLSSAFGRRPPFAEIANYLAVSEDRGQAALAEPSATESLFEERRNMTTLEERLRDLGSADAFERVELSITLQTLLRLLSDRERETILLRFGFRGEPAALSLIG